MRETPAVPKAIAAVVVTYVVSLVSGFIWLGLVLKVAGYMDGNPSRIVFSGSAKFLRHWWPLFLILPIIWTVYAVKAYRIDQGWMDAELAIGIGIALAVLVALWYIHTALHPVIGMPLPKSSAR